MRRTTIMVLAALLLLGSVATSQADYVNPVRFYVFDDPWNHDIDVGEVTLEVTIPFAGMFADLGNLYYGFGDNPDFTAVVPVTSSLAYITIPILGGQELVWLRYGLDEGGDLTFTGQVGALWTSLYVLWNTVQQFPIQMQSMAANNFDAVAPVPVPASLILLGSGLVGLLGLGRKKALFRN